MKNFLDKLEFTKPEKNIILDAKSFIGTSFEDDFKIYKTFNNKHIETLLIYTVICKKEPVLRYLNDLRKIKLSITGEDLLKLGLSPSKAFNEGFDYVLKEKLKKPNMTKADEIKSIQKYLG